MVDAVLTPDAEAPPIVGAGLQTLLHRLADGDVLELDLVGELHGLPDGFPGFKSFRIGKEPLEDRPRARVAERVAAKLTHHKLAVADLSAELDKVDRKRAMDGIRSGSIKRVATAVGEGSMAVRLVFERQSNQLAHEPLATH